MMIKQIRLSNASKDKLSRLKGKTGIHNWNVLCRWAFCYSLKEGIIPTDLKIESDSNVEMSWLTFAGEYYELYEAILKQWCIEQNLGIDQDTLVKYFKLHLERNGFEVTFVKPDSSGRMEPKELLEQVREDTLLVSVMHVNNETGIIQPVKQIGKALAKREVFFHIDAAQSFGKLVEVLQEIPYDFLSASAHKIYGPQGIGLLVLRKRRYKLPPVQSIMFGGEQEHGIRPGTLPTALIAGFGEACSIAQDNYIQNYAKYNEVRGRLLETFERNKIPYQINGSQEYCMPNTINIAFTGVNSEALMLASKQYCAMSNGSACNSHEYKPSYVLESMGIDPERIQSSVRISWGTQVDFNEVAKMSEVIKSFY